MFLVDFFGFDQTSTIRKIRRWLQWNSFHNIPIATIRLRYQRYAKSRTTVANIREALLSEAGYVIHDGRAIKTPRDKDDNTTANLRVRRDHPPGLLARRSV